MSLELTILNLDEVPLDYEGEEIPASFDEERNVKKVWDLKYAILILVSNYKPEDKKNAFETTLALDAIGRRLYQAGKDNLNELTVDTTEYELLMDALKELAGTLPPALVGFINDRLSTAKTMTTKEEADVIQSDES